MIGLKNTIGAVVSCAVVGFSATAAMGQPILTDRQIDAKCAGQETASLKLDCIFGLTQQRDEDLVWTRKREKPVILTDKQIDAECAEMYDDRQKLSCVTALTRTQQRELGHEELRKRRFDKPVPYPRTERLVLIPVIILQ